MGFNCDGVGRNDPPIFGMIFMASQSTKKECLKRKLFGLPPPQINLVKKVKHGMTLFLFEFEERKLYGVFEAISDGAMGIVPHAYEGKFPAQVRIRSTWICEPLYEHDFHNAIIDNYYTSNKFHIGVSKSQVSKLLALFDSRRMKIPNFKPLLRERLLREECLSRSGTRNPCRKGFESDERTLSVRGRSVNAVDIERVNVDRYPAISLSGIFSVLDKRIAKKDSFIFGGKGLSSSNQFRNLQFSPYPKDAVEGLFLSSPTEIIPFHLEAQNISSPPSRSMRSVNSHASLTLDDFIPLDDENQFEPVKSSMLPSRSENMNPSTPDAHELSLTTSVSSIENEKMNVFSRPVHKKGSIKVEYDSLGTNGNGLSVNKSMDVLYQRQAGKIIEESEHEVELGDIDKCVISEVAVNILEDALASEEQCFEESWLNFKRRKMQSERNGHIEESNSSSGTMLRKRRKLSRPSFVSGGTDKKFLTSYSCSSVDNSQVSSNEGACHDKEMPQNSCEEAMVELKYGKAEIHEGQGENKEALVSNKGGESGDNNEKEVSDKSGIQVGHHSDCSEHNTVQTVICSEKGLNSDKNKPDQNSDEQVALQSLRLDQSCGVSNGQDLEFQVKTYIEELNHLKEYSPNSLEN